MNPVQTVWAALVDAYGQCIIIEFGPAAPAHWVQVIDTLTPGELEQGLRRLKENAPPQRPNSLEFLDLCRPPRPRRYPGPLRSARARRDYFHTVPASPDVVDAALARIRQRLQQD
jgi:hypothetical protein